MYNPVYSFWSSVKQSEIPDPHMISEEIGCIRFTMLSAFNSRRDKKESKCVFDLSVVKQESEKTRVTRALGKKLSSIGVPQAQQAGIVSEILQVLQVAVPMLPIDVTMLEQTFTYGYFPGPYIYRVSPPARVDLKPATKASIQSLKKVRIDGLEEPESSTLCTICSDGLAEGDQDQLIARMPCSHLYHAHCIVKWLKINHLCPLCRYPMPINWQGL